MIPILKLILNNGITEFLFALEVMIELPFPDLRLFQDIADTGVIESLYMHQFRCNLDNLLSFFRLSLHHALTPWLCTNRSVRLCQLICPLSRSFSDAKKAEENLTGLLSDGVIVVKKLPAWRFRIVVCITHAKGQGPVFPRI